MLSRTYSLMFFLLSLEPLTQSPAELHTIMVPKKKTVERTAASSRPKRTPKPTTTATTSAPAPKPKKKTTAIKKAAPKKSATTAKVTKKAAPKKAAAKMAATKKAAPKKAAPKTAAPKYEKWVVKADGSNPLGPAAQAKIDARRAEERERKKVYGEIGSRYTIQFMDELKVMYTQSLAVGTFESIGSFEAFLEWSQDVDEQAWDIAHEKKIGTLEAQYSKKQMAEMIQDMYEKQERGEVPHIEDINDMLYWKEIEKERSKIIEEFKVKEAKEKQQYQQHRNGNGNGNRNGGGNRNGNVSAISSPVKKAQNTIVNASPVKKVQDAFTGGSNRSKSPGKKMTSNDSGYQADNEQQSVMSRTWELAANAVEAMRSAVNPE
jgi:hypothetical protein